jgi:hypothetical protein
LVEVSCPSLNWKRAFRRSDRNRFLKRLVATFPQSRVYEQVMFVKGFFLFSLHRALFLFFVVTHVVLHRVSIRTLSERLWLCAGWGSVENSMLPVFGRPRSGPNPTRSHRNTGSSQQVKHDLLPQAATAWNGT